MQLIGGPPAARGRGAELASAESGRQRHELPRPGRHGETSAARPAAQLQCQGRAELLLQSTQHGEERSAILGSVVCALRPCPWWGFFHACRWRRCSCEQGRSCLREPRWCLWRCGWENIRGGGWWDVNRDTATRIHWTQVDCLTASGQWFSSHSSTARRTTPTMVEQPGVTREAWKRACICSGANRTEVTAVSLGRARRVEISKTDSGMGVAVTLELQDIASKPYLLGLVSHYSRNMGRLHLQPESAIPRSLLRVLQQMSLL